MSDRDANAAEPAHNVLQAVAERLIPFFAGAGHDAGAARTAALAAIDSWRPENMVDILHIGRILAFSLAAISMAGQAAAADMPPEMQLRCLGKANALARSAEQSERAMTRQRQLRRDDPPRDSQTASAGTAQPPPPPPDADDAILALVEETMAEFRAFQATARAAQPASVQPLSLQPPPVPETAPPASHCWISHLGTPCARPC
jgi:hypothetical protein